MDDPSIDLQTLVALAKSGDMSAYETIVRRFQGMAVSYAYGILGDFHLAQDAAQDAFIAAHSDLRDLRATEAFISWFRKVIYKHCDRLTRSKQVPTVPLSQASWVSSGGTGPEERLLDEERAAQVRAAIGQLPAAEQPIMALFYFGDYSEEGVAAIMALPLSTVKNRLRSARKRLRERILAMVEETAAVQRQSRDEEFSDKVVEQVVRLQQTVPFLWVSDIERAVDFYVEGLGFTMIRHWEKEGQLRWCWLQQGGAALMIQVDRDGQEGPDVRGQGIVLYFICENAAAVYNQAQERGIAAAELQIGNGMQYTEIVDPDGYALCFESPATEGNEDLH